MPELWGKAEEMGVVEQLESFETSNKPQTSQNSKSKILFCTPRGAGWLDFCNCMKLAHESSPL